MDDGTMFRDYKSYVDFMERRRKIKKTILALLAASLLFFAGMKTQHCIDSLNSSKNSQCQEVK